VPQRLPQRQGSVMKRSGKIYDVGHNCLVGAFVIMYSRDLPHWHPEHAPLFVTCRLFGSLPRHMCHAAPTNAKATPKESAGKQFAMLDREMDRAATGPKWLRDPRVAGCVVEVLVRGAAVLRQYDLHAYVIMSNHVHLLITAHAMMRRVTAGIKGVSARHANTILGRTGKPFWQNESYDHWVRDDLEYQRICRYIESNPVRAGLVAKAEDCRWSSASPAGKANVTSRQVP
jgi:putative transposase